MTMKRTFILFVALVFSATLLAQKKTTTSAVIAFDASTAIDELPKAVNKTVIGALDTKTGKVQFEAAVKNFAFTNPSIQNHFNSAKWMNSDEFPKFSFTGTINELKKIRFTKDGEYKTTVTGDLIIKDVTKPITTPVTITVNGNEITTSASFTIRLADYGITGVPIDAGKVAKEPTISVSASLK